MIIEPAQTIDTEAWSQIAHVQQADLKLYYLYKGSWYFLNDVQDYKTDVNTISKQQIVHYTHWKKNWAD